ncbi:MAG: glycosyltransferase, partial [Thomasclavelia spiroformis]
VLGRNTGGICEVLNDGYNGFVINDEKDLCDKIIMLYENKKVYSYLSKNALITYQEKFTSKIIMEKYSQIYSEMINKNI